MFRHNLVVIFRHFLQHKSTFLINLIGLSAGLTCVLLIWLWINDEMQVDKFHAADDRLYQMMANHEDSEQIRTLQATPDQLAESLAAEMPEVEKATSYMPAELIPMKFILSASADKLVKGAGQFADPNFLQVFNYPLLQGNPEQALKAPNAIVLSENLAKAIFQSPENALGKAIHWQLANFNRDCIVTGVMKNVPAYSSNQFDFLLTMASFHDPQLFRRRVHWDNHAPSTIVVLKKGADAAAFDKKTAGFIKSKLASSKVSLFVKPYSANYLYGEYENGVQSGGRIVYVRLFGLIALIILLIACINFTNLSTAQASSRIKEVGIKKAIGVSRSGLALQFMGESMLLSLLSLLLATGLVQLLLPNFNTLTGKALNLQSSLDWLMPFAGIALATGLIAGSYPALYLSNFQPLAMIKGVVHRNLRERLARKTLVVAQFAISVAFIVAVIVVYQQIRLVQTKDMGFNREQVLYFGREGRLGEAQGAFLTELKKRPGVLQASAISGDFLGENSFTTGIDWPGKQATDMLTFTNLGCTYDLIETLGIQVVEGRSFSPAFGADSAAIVFNETAVAAMHLENPVGKTVQLWGENRQIIGVVKDFNLKSLREPLKPAFFRLIPNETTSIMVRLEAGQERSAVAGIEQLYKSFNPGYTFDYRFLDEDFHKQYASEFRVSVLSRYFAGLAVLLSCLGLFGLAAFTAEQRTKEIGIRKVLGATVAGITALLARDFLKLVLISILIASPLAYFFLEKWLSGFVYRVHLQGWPFVAAGAGAVLIAFLTVGFQSIKAALVNPVESLRSE